MDKATDKATEALLVVYNLLGSHPTNAKRLSLGQSGYCAITRHAYLEAWDALRKLGVIDANTN